MKRYVFSAVFCLVASAAFAGTWETSGFRTANGQLVRVGMTKAEVRVDAGAPTDKGKTQVKNSSGSGKRGGGEVWTYRGSDGIYSVSFIGDRVARIEVAPFR